jgi:hypothetical protein
LPRSIGLSTTSEMECPLSRSLKWRAHDDAIVFARAVVRADEANRRGESRPVDGEDNLSALVWFAGEHLVGESRRR